MVAEVNGELWDMHRPLEVDCSLKLFHFKENISQQAFLVNKVFWRSCSFILGAVIENAFQDNVSVVLHSFPSANGNLFLKTDKNSKTPQEFFNLFFIF